MAFSQFKDVFKLFILIGPLACITAASMGISSLLLTGVLQSDHIMTHWLTWWMGDIIGILVFTPLVLVAPQKEKRIIWQGAPLGSLSILALLLLIAPLGLTFYAWKFTSKKIYESSHEEFKTLASENEQALHYRIDSYSHAILSGIGFFNGSTNVSRQDWRAYAKTIDAQKNFPGINGIGYVENVKPDQKKSFLKRQRTEAPDFKIHPDTQHPPYYIISYIEPEHANLAAIGLNIAFEKNRLEALELSRDTGASTITKRIVLVQDEMKRPGFLLLHPIYQQGFSYGSLEQRRKALHGWVYAPIIAEHLLENLTNSQGTLLNLTIYDGNDIDPDKLIYTSQTTKKEKTHIPNIIKKNIRVMQQD